MNPLADGAVRAFRGLRTGNKQSLYSGAFLLAYGLWRRNRGRKELLYRRTLKPGEAVIIRGSRAGRRRIVVDDDLADQLKDR